MLSPPDKTVSGWPETIESSSHVPWLLVLIILSISMIVLVFNLSSLSNVV
jgi:hypothetical protein